MLRFLKICLIRAFLPVVYAMAAWPSLKWLRVQKETTVPSVFEKETSLKCGDNPTLLNCNSLLELLKQAVFVCPKLNI